MLANHRTEVEILLDEWSQNHKQGKNLINCLVEFLSEDVMWLKENIGLADRDKLKKLVSEI